LQNGTKYAANVHTLCHSGNFISCLILAKRYTPGIKNTQFWQKNLRHLGLKILNLVTNRLIWSKYLQKSTKVLTS